MQRTLMLIGVGQWRDCELKWVHCLDLPLLVQDWNANLLVSGLGTGLHRCEIRQRAEFEAGEGVVTGIGVTYEFQID